MNLDLNFDSLVIAPPDTEKNYGATRPPIPSPPNCSNNLVNIGPFSIQKLNIPDGFYTNPASWSKSSTGSGHTEHEEDSQYRIDLSRLEHLGISDPFRKSSPSYHQAQLSTSQYNEDILRQLSSTSRNSISNNNDLNLPFPNINDVNGNHHGDLPVPPYRQMSPSVQQINDKLYQQIQMQKRMIEHQEGSSRSAASTPLASALPPRTLVHNPYGSQIPTTGMSPGLYGDHQQPQHEPIMVQTNSGSRNNTPRSMIQKYSPTASMACSADNDRWKTLTPITGSVFSIQPVRGTTPTNKGYASAPPASPAAGYQLQHAQASQSGVNGLIYQVQFKCASKNYILGSQAHPTIMVGDFVVVEADRGEDIGLVVEVLPMKTFVERRIYMKATVDDENVIGRILRLASVAERQFLPEKFHDEENIVQFCRELAYSTYRLPMVIHDVEYQFDRHKLTIYYNSDARVDFREFVRDLFSAYKARIWMKKVPPSNKPIRIDNWASVALATGMQFTPDSGK